MNGKSNASRYDNAVRFQFVHSLGKYERVNTKQRRVREREREIKKAQQKRPANAIGESEYRRLARSSAALRQERQGK